MGSGADSTGGRAALASRPDSSKGPPALVWPRTVDGAHQRLDFYEGRLDELYEQIGEEPQPVQGREGSGLLKFLHGVYQLQKKANERDEAWRVRWTLLAAVLGVLLTASNIVNVVRTWVRDDKAVPSATAAPR